MFFMMINNKIDHTNRSEKKNSYEFKMAINNRNNLQ